MTSQKKRVVLDEKRRIRNVSDYISDSLRRLSEYEEFLSYLKKNSGKFIDSETGYSYWIIISLVDVYSRECTITISRIFDDDPRTSSICTLVSLIKDESTRNKYVKRLKLLKAKINLLIQARSNQIAHFNTALNIHEHGHIQLNQLTEMDTVYLRKIMKQTNTFLEALREELDIEGLFGFSGGEPLSTSFEKLLRCD